MRAGTANSPHAGSKTSDGIRNRTSTPGEFAVAGVLLFCCGALFCAVAISSTLRPATPFQWSVVGAFSALALAGIGLTLYGAIRGILEATRVIDKTPAYKGPDEPTLSTGEVLGILAGYFLRMAAQNSSSIGSRISLTYAGTSLLRKRNMKGNIGVKLSAILGTLIFSLGMLLFASSASLLSGTERQIALLGCGAGSLIMLFGLAILISASVSLIHSRHSAQSQPKAAK